MSQRAATAQASTAAAFKVLNIFLFKASFYYFCIKLSAKARNTLCHGSG